MKLLEVIKDLEDIYNEIDTTVIEDGTEIAGDIFKIFKVLSKCSNVIRKKNFQLFLKGFDSQDNLETQLEKLVRYIKAKVNSEYLVQYIAKVIESKSKKTSFLRGIRVFQ